MSAIVSGVLEHLRLHPFASIFIVVLLCTPFVVFYVISTVYNPLKLEAEAKAYARKKKKDEWTDDDDKHMGQDAATGNVSLDHELGLTARSPRELGGECDKYVWLQTEDEIVLEAFFPEDTRAKECKVNITSNSISVHVKGQEVISGDLPKVRPIRLTCVAKT